MNLDNVRFLAELKKVYYQIDKKSDLYWSHVDDSELVRQSGNKRTLRSKISDDKKADSK